MPRRRSLLIIAFLLLSTTAVEAQPARVRLARETMSNGEVRVSAVVTDGAGSPVEDAPVTFRIRTAFGWLELSEAETDGDGMASVMLPSAFHYSEVAVEAQAANEVLVALLKGSVAQRDPAVRPGLGVLRSVSPQPGFISPYPVTLQVLFLGAILGGIWITYAYLVSLLLGIRRMR